MQPAIPEEWEEAKGESSQGRIFQLHTQPGDTLSHVEARPQRGEGQAHSHLGKPIAASPLLVQAVVQEPLANGLSDFD